MSKFVIGKDVAISGAGRSRQALKRGINLVETNAPTPLLLTAKGITRSNLIGNLGNFSTAVNGVPGGFYAHPTGDLKGATLTLPDGTLYGGKAVRITSNSGDTNIYRTVGINLRFRARAGRYYLAVVDAKTDGTSKGRIAIAVNGSTLNENIFNTSGPKYARINPSVDGEFHVYLQNVNDLGVTGWVEFEGLRVFEIGSTEYSALASTNLDDVFPYVEGAKHIVNPTAISTSKNLLPPTTEWRTIGGRGWANEPDKIYVNNPTGQFHGLVATVPLLPNQAYTLSLGDAGGGDKYFKMVFYNANRQEIGSQRYAVNGPGSFTTPSVTFTTPADVSYGQVEAGNRIIGETVWFNFPQLELGSERTPYEYQNTDYLVVKTSLASSVNQGSFDMLFYRDGQYVKNKIYQTDVVLDGSKAAALHADETGFKRIRIKVIDDKNYTETETRVYKHLTGRSLTRKDDAFNWETDMFAGLFDFNSDPGYLYLAVSDSDTGWKETQTPNDNFVKAFLNGWKYTGDGSSTHSWASLVDNSQPVSNTEDFVAANRASSFQPYTMDYKLLHVIEENLEVEGAIMLNGGRNQVELLDGIVCQEPLAPTFNSTNKEYYINFGSEGSPGTATSVPTARILRVHKNGKPDLAWKNYTETSPKLVMKSALKVTEYEAGAVYSLTYVPRETYRRTMKQTQAAGEYNASVRGALEGIAQRVSDNEANIANIEQRYKDILLKSEGQRVEVGTIFITVPAGQTAQLAITFKRAFKEAPTVFLDVSTASPQLYQAGASGTTATGTTITGYNGFSQETQLTVRYIAIGRG